MLFDGLVVLVVALAAVFGARKGFARLSAGVLAPIAGVLAGWPLSAELQFLNRWAAFALLYLLLTLVVFAAAALTRRRLERWRLEAWDGHLGLVLGAVQGCVLALVLTLIALGVSADVRDAVASSRAGVLMAQAVREVRPLLTPGAADLLGPWLDLLQRRNA